MACRGVHFALTVEEREQLLALVETQGDVIGFIQEDIEEQWDTEWLCETDKAWDAIHRASQTARSRPRIRLRSTGVSSTVPKCTSAMTSSFPLSILQW